MLQKLKISTNLLYHLACKQTLPVKITKELNGFKLNFLPLVLYSGKTEYVYIIMLDFLQGTLIVMLMLWELMHSGHFLWEELYVDYLNFTELLILCVLVFEFCSMNVVLLEM